MSNRPHKNLEVYKESIRLVKDMYKATKTFPDDEKFGIISQIKRASVSIPANLAEGAARKSNKEFKQFLHISLGSLSELDTLLEVSKELEFINIDDYKQFEKKMDRVNALLIGLIKKIDKDIKS